MIRTPWAAAVALSVFLLTAVGASATQRDDLSVRVAPHLPELSLSSSGAEQNVALLTADPGAGDVSLTGINSTLTVTCSGTCTGISGQGSNSVVVPASNFSSTVRVALTPTGTGKAGVRAQQGGTTVEIGMGTSGSSGGSSSSTSTSTTVTSSSSAGTTVVTTNGNTVTSGSTRSGSFAIFVFVGGDYNALLTAGNCPARAVAFWAILGGEFLTYVPTAQVSIVNAAFLSAFPRGVPAHTPLISFCSA
jgi:hypothetical protein